MEDDPSLLCVVTEETVVSDSSLPCVVTEETVVVDPLLLVIVSLALITVGTKRRARRVQIHSYFVLLQKKQLWWIHCYLLLYRWP